MREDLMNQVLQDLEDQRRRNEIIAREHRQTIRSREPEIAALMERREALIQQGMRGILAGHAAAGNLPERMEEISGRIHLALEKHGYPADYLSPVYSCALCRDTGFVGDRVRERCSCVQRRYQEKLRAAIGLPEDGRETFENFDPELFPEERTEGSSFTQRESILLVREACEQWVDLYPRQNPRDLVLSGKSGLGKTFLLHAMASRLIGRGTQVLLLSAYQFLETARRSYFEGEDGLEEVIGAEVLMLDDLGSEPLMQNVTVEQLFNLINERQRRNLATVISTNLNPEELKGRYTERIASRLTDRRNVLMLQLQGRDIRNGRA